MSDRDSASAKTFELVGFDGSSRPYQAFELQIVFLGKRFTGYFCLVDDEIGILGRDILNQIAVIFDGPNQEWDIFNAANPEIDS